MRKKVILPITTVYKCQCALLNFIVADNGTTNAEDAIEYMWLRWKLLLRMLLPIDVI